MPLDKRVGAWKATKADPSQAAINGLNRSIAKATQDFLSEVKELHKKEQQEKAQEKEQSIKQEKEQEKEQSIKQEEGSKSSSSEWDVHNRDEVWSEFLADLNRSSSPDSSPELLPDSSPELLPTTFQ